MKDRFKNIDTNYFGEISTSVQKKSLQPREPVKRKWPTFETLKKNRCCNCKEGFESIGLARSFDIERRNTGGTGARTMHFCCVRHIRERRTPAAQSDNSHIVRGSERRICVAGRCEYRCIENHTRVRLCANVKLKRRHGRCYATKRNERLYIIPRVRNC